jgi:O-antigen ligase
LPDIGQEYLQGAQVWKGWHFHKNGLGFPAAIAFLFFAFRPLSVDVRNYWVYWVLCVLSFLVLFKSGSATALISLSVGAGIAIYLSLANGLRLSGQITGLLLSLLLVLIAVVSTIIIFAGNVEILTGLVGRSGDLTGRTGLWKMVVSLIMERPWLGFGYGTLWTPTPGTESIIGPLLEHQLRWLPPHAHNGFLNIASQLGIPIALIATTFSIQALMEPLRLYLRTPSSFVLLIVALLSALTVRTLTEQVIFTDRTLNWIIFVALPILLLRSPQRIDMPLKKSNASRKLLPNLRRNKYLKHD